MAPQCGVGRPLHDRAPLSSLAILCGRDDALFNYEIDCAEVLADPPAYERDVRPI